MLFNWLKKQKKEPPSSSRSTIIIASGDSAALNGNIHRHEQQLQTSLKGLSTNKENGGHCGFATGETDTIEKSDRDLMSAEKPSALQEKLRADELFRVRLLTANSIDERREIIEAADIFCSTQELQETLDSYVKENAIEVFDNRSLWGNRVT